VLLGPYSHLSCQTSLKSLHPVQGKHFFAEVYYLPVLNRLCRLVKALNHSFALEERLAEVQDDRCVKADNDFVKEAVRAQAEPVKIVSLKAIEESSLVVTAAALFILNSPANYPHAGPETPEI